MALGEGVMEEMEPLFDTGHMRFARSLRTATFSFHRFNQSGRGHAERTTLIAREYAVIISFSPRTGTHGGMVLRYAVPTHVFQLFGQAR